MGAPTSPEVMRDALMAARKFVSAGMNSFIETECLLDKKLRPRIHTMEPAGRVVLERYRAMLHQIDDALGRRGKGAKQ